MKYSKWHPKVLWVFFWYYCTGREWYGKWDED